MQITSLQNAKVKYWVSLKNKKIRDQEQVFLIEGDDLINEAIKQDLILETISTTNQNADYYVTPDIMKKISTQVSISNNAAICRFPTKNELIGNIIILDDIQDPGNLGTIIRSAVAFNFQTIILGESCVDIYNEKTIRASKGAIFHINYIRGNLLDIIPTLKKEYLVLATTINEGNSIKTYKKQKIALVMGNEGSGIQPSVQELCDASVSIPMTDKAESLNVAIATSIFMYEVYND